MERVRSASAAEDRDGADTEAVGGMMGTIKSNASISRRMPRVSWKFSQSRLRRVLILPLRRAYSMRTLLHADGPAFRSPGMRGGAFHAAELAARLPVRTNPLVGPGLTSI